MDVLSPNGNTGINGRVGNTGINGRIKDAGGSQVTTGRGNGSPLIKRHDTPRLTSMSPKQMNSQAANQTPVVKRFQPGQRQQFINGGNNGTGDPPVCKSNPIKILHFADQSVVVQQLTSGAADASYQDSPVSGYYVAQNSGKVEQGPVTVALAPEGIVVRKDNAPFENAVKAALATIRADGTYKSILTHWGQLSSAYPPLAS